MQRASAEEIASEDKPPILGVPEDQREISNQPWNCLVVPSFDRPHDNRGITKRSCFVGFDPQQSAKPVAIVEANVRDQCPAGAASANRASVMRIFRKRGAEPPTNGDSALMRNDPDVRSINLLTAEHAFRGLTR